MKTKVAKGQALKFDASAVEELVGPMLLRPLPTAACDRLARYVQLLYRWNAHMSLTAVSPEDWLQLHVAECLRGAQLLPAGISTVLDVGSGAGLPGIPMQIARPELRVVLAESQHKKAAFLREAIRETGLDGMQVYEGRVEDMPPGQQFDLVTLRAVDRMDRALRAAARRIASGGFCMVFTSFRQQGEIRATAAGLDWQPPHLIPGTEQRAILLGRNLES